MRRALAARDLPALMVEVRDAHGWTQAELGRQIGYSQSWVSRTLGGQQALTTDQAQQVAVRLGVPAHLWGGDPATRREFAQLTASIGLGPALDRAEQARLSLEHLLAGETSDRDLADWEHTADAFARASGRVPPSTLLPELMAEFRELALLLRSRPRSRAATALLAVSGQLAGIAAVEYVALGDEHAARRWWRTTRRAAERAGDEPLAAFAAGRQAVLLLYTTTPLRRILAVADRAIAVTDRAPYPGVMSALAAKAQTLAALGARRDALVALAELDALFGRLPEAATRQAHAFAWPEHRLRHVESYVHSRLGDVGRAAEAQDHAQQLYPSRLSTGATQVELHRAGCLIHAGDVREGVEHATSIAGQLSDEQRADQLIRVEARRVLARVPRPARQLPAVTEYRDLITTGA